MDAIAELEVEIALLPTSTSVLKAPLGSGFRPNHKHPVSGDFFIGSINFSDGGSIAPGKSRVASVKLIATSEQLRTLRQFGSWTIWAGPVNHIGSVRIIRPGHGLG